MPSVTELLIEGLREAGVQRLFVAPGGLRDTAAAHGLSVVEVSSGTSACIMAAVTGELTGVPGAALVPRGASAAAGLAYARDNRAPLIVMMDQAPGADPDEALAKQALAVTADSVSHRIAHAARLALTEPRGPVRLELATDVAGLPALPVATSLAPPAPLAPAPEALDAAAELIRRASRPLVIAGLGCRATDAGWLRAFVEALPAPALMTRKAKGVVPEPHPLALGVFTGGYLEEPVVERADLLIAVGLDPIELPPGRWPNAQPVVHISRAPHADDHYRAAVEVAGEPGLIFEELAPRLRGQARADWDVAEVDRMKREQERRMAAAAGPTLYRIVQAARELTEAGTIAAIGGGAGVLPAALVWQAVALGECLVPVAPGTSGGALPAALAAQLAFPERRILCFTDGDGLRRAALDLATATRLDLQIIVIVLDAGRTQIDLTALARRFGLIVGVADAEAPRRAILNALDTARPALIQVEVSTTAHDDGAR